jgi:hypothetical protein
VFHLHSSRGAILGWASLLVLDLVFFCVWLAAAAADAVQSSLRVWSWEGFRLMNWSDVLMVGNRNTTTTTRSQCVCRV